MKPCCLCCYQTFALFIKNLLFALRRPVLTLFQLLIPSLILLILYAATQSLNSDLPVSQPLSVIPHEKSPQVLPYAFYYRGEPGTVEEEEDIKSENNGVDEEVFGHLLDALATHLGFSRLGTNESFDVKNFGNCPDRTLCEIDIYPGDMFNLEPFLAKWDWRFSELGILWIGAPYGPEPDFDWRSAQLNNVSPQDDQNVTFSYTVLRNLSTTLLNPFLGVQDGPQSFDRGLTLQTALFHAVADANTNHHSRITSSLTLETFLGDFQTGGSGLHVDPVDLLSYPILFVSVFLSTLMIWFKINHERRVRLRHGLILNGLMEPSYWCSWFLSETLLLCASMLVLIGVGAALKYKFFEHVSFGALFIVFFAFAIALLTQWLMCSAFECCSGTACTVVVAFIFGDVCVFIVVIMMSAPRFANVWISYPVLFLVQVLPVFAWCKLLWDVKLRIESTAGHFYFVDLFRRSLLGDGYNNVLKVIPPYGTLIFLLLDIILGFLLTLYFDAIVSSSEKVARRCCCCVEWLIACCSRRRDRMSVDSVLHDEENEASVIPDLDSDIYREYQLVLQSLQSDPEGTDFPLKIVKVSKTYAKWYAKAKSTIALSGITLCGKKSEVLVILGHNGAGKTTLVDVLTGTMPASTGDCLIGSRSVSKSVRAIKSSFGICPQFDVVVPELTVLQHIYLYAALKGVLPWDPQLDVILHYLELDKLRHQIAWKCSGGEKRRLTFACAVIGDPKILFLDEPSSGLDPVRREKVWNYIVKLKKDRVVVLTTHSMEEADAIGDKIAFLALGGLRAIGTPAHLKKRFGCGFQMDIVLDDPSDVSSFKEEMRSLSPRLMINTEVHSSITYSLPFSVDRETKMGVFRYLETQHDQRRIKSFRLSHTTLEEVFMNVTHGNSRLLQVMEHHDLSDLSIIMENQSEAFTTVQVSRTDTLSNIRRHLVQHCAAAIGGPFLFLFQGGVIQLPHEANRNAASFLPLIQLRRVGQPIQEVVPSFQVPPGEVSMVDSLVAKLKDKDSQLEQQRIEISGLRDRISELERVIESGSHVRGGEE